MSTKPNLSRPSCGYLKSAGQGEERPAPPRKAAEIEHKDFLINFNDLGYLSGPVFHKPAIINPAGQATNVSLTILRLQTLTTWCTLT